MIYDQHMRRRLNRVEGQIRGVLKMMEEERCCKEVVGQLSAVRSAIDKTMALVVAVNLEQCIKDEQSTGGDTGKVVQEAVELLVKSR